MGKMSFLLVSCLLAISIMIVGCTSMKNSTATATEKHLESPITIIVPFSVGSGSDILARMLEKSTIKYLDQPLIVINKPGGTGSKAWNELSVSNPDGYTIGISSIELLLQPIYGPTKYNYPTSLEPLAQIASVPMVLAVKANQPWKDLNEFIKYGKQHPGKLNYSHMGVGSLNHIVGEQISISAGIKLTQVPFQSGPEAVAALLGEHVQAAIVSPIQVKEHIKNGTIRVLAVTADHRLTDPIFADVPTFKEQGLDIVYNNWFGIVVPKEIPIQIKTRLSEELKEIITAPEFKKDIELIGFEYEYLGPQELAEKWITDKQKLTKAIQETEILDLIKSQKK